VPRSSAAPRTEDDLNRALRRIAQRYETLIREFARTLLPDLARASARFERDRTTLWFPLQGIALNRIVQPDDTRTRRTIADFVATCATPPEA